MSGRISVVIALVMVFVAVMLSCSKKTQAQTTPQTSTMFIEQKISLGYVDLVKVRDPEGAVCYVSQTSKGTGIACLR